MKNDLPKGWTIGVFKDLAYIEMGQSPEGSTYNSDMVGMPLLNGPTEFTERYPRKIQWTSKPSKICNEGDILICVRGSSTGRINISNDRYCIGRGVAAIRGNDKSLTLFLEYLIQYVVQKILILSSGSTFPSVDKATLSTIPISIPPLPEQQKIAQILSTWDKAIQTTQHLLDKLESRKKGMMEELLNGKIRVKGFENSKWKLKKLHELITPMIREVPKPNEAFLGLGLRSHVKGTFLKHNFDPNKIEMESLFTVRENDLIVNITFAWEGAIAIATLEDDGALVSHRFPTYTFIEGKSSSDYFKHFIRLPRLRFLLELISPGGAGRNRVMSKKDFIQLEFPFPLIEEQTAIAKILNTADTEIQETKAYLKTLKQQKKGLMQSLLTGRIIVRTNG